MAQKPAPKSSNSHVPHITVGHFYANHAEKLGMRLEGSSSGLNRLIREPTINRPGLALCGFFNYFAVKRIQVIGAAELSYLKSLKAPEVKERLRALFSKNMPCLIVARNSPVPEVLLEVAGEFETPVFRTSMITMKFINAATISLEFDFAPSASEHGSMVDILGVGTLIRGASGIGKSECVLGLIERGYSIVSDDLTRFRSIEGRELLGMSDNLSRYHMEVRGIGIINIASMFGAGAVRAEKRLDFVVTLKDWHELEDVDRIGLDRENYEILGIKIPHVTLPVRTGRDLARLVEVAALDQKLKDMGENSAVEFNQRLLHMISERRSR
ncbi:MAG: HPr(Ser) kinase/phosphatase [Verrucomicrobiaceae bacterium]|nr:MAG: HPr(Ser) kinase/phosphatase [Verrucomicrobiaceae bacterium]